MKMIDIFCRSKPTPNVPNDICSVWLPMSKRFRLMPEFSFTYYEYKIDKIIYTHDSLEWQKALQRIQLWNRLSGEK